MRPELKRIEIIEKYLNNEFSEKDQKEFEKRLEEDPKLREELEQQQELVETIKRQGIRQSVNKAKKSYAIQQSLKGIIPGSLIGLGLGAALFFGLPLNTETANLIPAPEKTKNGEDSPINVTAQIFIIETTTAQVLEGNQGTVIAIPEDAFEDEEGNLVNKEVTISLKEALDAETILQSGLSTMSDSIALETGGMFELKAKSGNKELKLREGKEILVNVPTDQRLEGMQLYDGESQSDGSINWVKPKPVENYLIPQDIMSLKYYNRGFLSHLQKLGKDTNDRKYVDSLFYSFYCAELTAIDEEYLESSGTEKRGVRRSNLDLQPDTIVGIFISDSAALCCQLIWPADIKAFWNERFQSTNLATKEFESRMKFLSHKKALEVYLTNLDKPLYYSDSIIANSHVFNCSPAKFAQFYSRRDGRVKSNSQSLEKLAAYYYTKRKLYSQTIKKTQEEFWKKQNQLDKERFKESSDQGLKNMERLTKNFTQEFQKNLKEAYRQIGVKLPKSRPGQSQYRGSIRTLGWKNFDRRLARKTKKRDSFYAVVNGKRIAIEYKKLKVEVDNVDSYDRIYSYVVSRDQYSFMRMKRKNNSFEFQLNDLFKYHILIVAYKGDQAYFGEEKPSDSTSFQMDLKQISRDELSKQIKAYSKTKASLDIFEDLRVKKFLFKDDKRVQNNSTIKELRRELRPVFTEQDLYCRNEYEWREPLGSN